MSYPFLDPIRAVIPAAARQRWYDASTAIITMLAMWGLLGTSEAPAWVSLAISIITLIFAILYSENTVRVAFYTTLVSFQTIAGIYGIWNQQKWTAVIAFAAAVLGTSVAGSNVGTLVAKAPK